MSLIGKHFIAEVYIITVFEKCFNPLKKEIENLALISDAPKSYVDNLHTITKLPFSTLLIDEDKVQCLKGAITISGLYSKEMREKTNFLLKSTLDFFQDISLVQALLAKFLNKKFTYALLVEAFPELKGTDLISNLIKNEMGKEFSNNSKEEFNAFLIENEEYFDIINKYRVQSMLID